MRVKMLRCRDDETSFVQPPDGARISAAIVIAAAVSAFGRRTYTRVFSFPVASQGLPLPFGDALPRRALETAEPAEIAAIRASPGEC